MESRSIRAHRTFRLPMLLVESRQQDQAMKPVHKYLVKGPSNRLSSDIYGSAPENLDKKSPRFASKQQTRPNMMFHRERTAPERFLIKKDSKKSLISVDAGILSPLAEPWPTKSEFTVHRSTIVVQSNATNMNPSTEKPNYVTRQSFPGLELLADPSLKTQETPHIVKMDNKISRSHRGSSPQYTDANQCEEPNDVLFKLYDGFGDHVQIDDDGSIVPKCLHTDVPKDLLIHTELKQLSDGLLRQLSSKETKPKTFHLGDKESEEILRRIEFVEMDGDTKCRCWLGSLEEFLEVSDV